jgi:hypothetical protein
MADKIEKQVNVGKIVGRKGDKGDKGPLGPAGAIDTPVVFRSKGLDPTCPDGIIQYKIGSGEWKKLINTAELAFMTPPAGPPPPPPAVLRIYYPSKFDTPDSYGNWIINGDTGAAAGEKIITAGTGFAINVAGHSKDSVTDDIVNRTFFAVPKSLTPTVTAGLVAGGMPIDVTKSSAYTGYTESGDSEEYFMWTFNDDNYPEAGADLFVVLN